MPYIHTHTWGVCVCVCVCVSQSKRENHPVPQEGGWEIEWPYIHKDMVCVCVCVYGKRENHPVPQVPPCGTGWFSLLPSHHVFVGSPSSLARTHSWKPQNRRGWGRGCRRNGPQNRRGGGRRCRRSRGISCSTGGGGRIYIHRNIYIYIYATPSKIYVFLLFCRAFYGLDSLPTMSGFVRLLMYTYMHPP